MAELKTRTRTTKHGLTRHERIELDLDMNTPEGWAEFASRIPSLTDKLDQIEELARKILRQAGLPDDMRLRPQGADRWVDVVEMVEGKPHTREWFAANLLRWCHATRSYLEAADAEEATNSFGRVIRLWTIAEFKEVWEVDTLQGVKTRESRAVGAEVARLKAQHIIAARDRKLVASAHALLVQKTYRSRRALARDLARKFRDLSERTIERTLEKFDLPRT